MIYAADIEATVERPITAYWIGLRNIEKDHVIEFKTQFKKNRTSKQAIEQFMHYIFAKCPDKSVIFFHNLKGYDHAFIYAWCRKQQLSKEQMYGSPKHFTIVQDKKSITFFDSLELLSASIKDLGIILGLHKGDNTPLVVSIDNQQTTYYTDSSKTEIKTSDQPIQTLMKTEGWDSYAKRDVAILATAIKTFGLDQLYKHGIRTKAKWAWELLRHENREGWLHEERIPWTNTSHYDNKTAKLVNTVIADSYKGGLTFVNPIYQNQLIEKEGTVYDINSMYPWIYSSVPLPKPMPIPVTGLTAANYKDENYCHIFAIKNLNATLKETATMPFLKLKTTHKETNAKNYLKHYHVHGFTTITEMEWELLQETYEHISYDTIIIYRFERDRELEEQFKIHCNTWYHKKQHATDPASRFIAKLMLNSAYGKAGQLTKDDDDKEYIFEDVDRFLEKKVRNNWPNETAIHEKIETLKKHVHYNGNQPYFHKKVISGYDFANVAAASFITAAGRCYLARMINIIGNDFIYCDTDSIHCFGKDHDLPISEQLGDFKIERLFTKGKWIKAKTYAEYDGTWHFTIAGYSEQLSIDQFYEGNTISNKKRTYVDDGIQLTTHTFTL